MRVAGRRLFRRFAALLAQLPHAAARAFRSASTSRSTSASARRTARPPPSAVVVDAWMPAHKHGMNYKAEVKPYGGGRFYADGTDVPHARPVAVSVRRRRRAHHRKHSDRMRIGSHRASPRQRQPASRMQSTSRRRRCARSCGTVPGHRRGSPIRRTASRASPDAITLGESSSSSRAFRRKAAVLCATCHVPYRGWQDGRARGMGHVEVDRNTQSLVQRALEPLVRLGRRGRFALGAEHPPAAGRARDGRRTRRTRRRSSAADAEYSCRLSACVRRRSARGRRSAAGRHRQSARRVPGDAGQRPHSRSTIFAMRSSVAMRRRPRAYPDARAARTEDLRRQGQLQHVPRRPGIHATANSTTSASRSSSGPGEVDAGAARRHPAAEAEQRSTCSAATTTIASGSRRDQDEARRARSPQLRRVQGSRRCATSRRPLRTCIAARLATLTEVVRHYSDLNIDRLHADGEAILKPLKLTRAGSRGSRRVSRVADRAEERRCSRPDLHGSCTNP